MNADIFATWLTRQGHRVLRTESSYWYEAGPRVYQAFPYHCIIEPSTDEISRLARDYHAIGLRYSAPVDSPRGVVSYHVVYEEPHYSLAALPKKARYDVRKGLDYFKVEPISFDRLAAEGWYLHFETLQRQGRTDVEKKDWWQKLCYSAKGLPGFEAWGAISSEGKLAAALMTFTCDDCCSILYQQSLTQYLSYGVNNTLTFAFTSEVTRRPEALWLFYGLRSLDASSSVDEFKFRMGYKPKPVKQRVVFHPYLTPLLNDVSYSFVLRLKHLLPRSSMLAKLEGMLRICLEERKL